MYANSPQVKGRVGHGNRTHQDRLVNFDYIFFSQTERQVRNDYTISLAGQYIQLLHSVKPLLSPRHSVTVRITLIILFTSFGMISNFLLKYLIINPNLDRGQSCILLQLIHGDVLGRVKLVMLSNYLFNSWVNSLQATPSVRYPTFSLSLSQKCRTIIHPDISFGFYILTFLKSYYKI